MKLIEEDWRVEGSFGAKILLDTLTPHVGSLAICSTI